jgi:hypothetical protein
VYGKSIFSSSFSVYKIAKYQTEAQYRI